jgi:CheY-like chemotaxis protein
VNGPQRSILSVEDDDAAHYLLGIALKDVGEEFRVYRVRNGIDALEFLGRAGSFKDVPTPNLVLADLNMPRMGGLAFLQEMQKDPALRKIPVVVLSSSRLVRDRDRSLALGAKHFVTKSSTYAEFAADIKVACGYIDGDALAATTL